MKTLGLLGGMSWESTVTYYQEINRHVRSMKGGLHSAPCIVYSFDFAQIEALQRAGEWDEAGRLLEEAAAALQRAGAEAIVLCTNTMHSVSQGIEAASSLPLLHIADPTAERIVRAGFHTVGLLGTRFTMEQDFYKARLRDKFGLTAVVPDAEGRGEVHNIIYQELCNGIVQDRSRETYHRVIAGLKTAGAECLILGCTEIGLLLKEWTPRSAVGCPSLTPPRFMRSQWPTGPWRRRLAEAETERDTMDPHFCRHADASLGPVIPAGCRMGSGDSFDFTLLFEQVALTIVPCGIFLTGALLRVRDLAEARRVSEVDWKHQGKLTLASIYAFLKLAIVILWAMPSSGLPLSGASIVSTIFPLLVAVTLPGLSHYEHTRTINPSNLLSAYLNFTFMFDAAIARTLWLTSKTSSSCIALPAVFTAAVAVKGALLLLEASPKTALAPSRGKASPPETLGSVYFQGFFGWAAPLVRSRSRGAIDLEDLEALDGASEKSDSTTSKA